jgi:TetR/AcrR family transcriptional repressor of nem operon
MRYSTQHKAQTHDRLVKTAAKQFRRRGLQGIGIAKLMGGMGLTHGGFYAHFDNKNELVAAAATTIFKEAVTQIEASAAAAPKGRELAAIISGYLSTGHRDTTQGCLLPSLAGEMTRQPQTVRKAFTHAFEEYANAVSKYLPGPGDEERRNQAQLLFSGMAGTMMVARAVSDRQLSDTLLAQGREFYMSVFQPREGRAHG